MYCARPLADLTPFFFSLHNARVLLGVPDSGLNKLTHNSSRLRMMWWQENLLHFMNNLSSLNSGFSLFNGFFFPGGGMGPLPLNIGKIVGPCSCVGSMCSTLCTECMDG